MKVLIMSCLMASAIASLEPAGYRPPGSSPSSSYLPPIHQNSANFGGLAKNYLLPLQKISNDHYVNSSINSQRDDSEKTPSSVYSPSASNRVTPGSSPLSPYIPPSHQKSANFGGLAKNYLLPLQKSSNDRYAHSSINSQGDDSEKIPSSVYLPAASNSDTFRQYKAPLFSAVPAERGSSSSSSSFSSPSASYSSPSYSSSSYSSPSYSSPSPSYSSPSTSYSSPSPSYASPSSSYSSPSHSSPSSSKSSPLASSASHASSSSSYSSQPALHSSPAMSYAAPESGYEPSTRTPSAKYFSSNERSALTQALEESEPANYNFAYQVNDEYGNDFSHKENRQNEKSSGVYSVLLPDGRKQIVQYEADEEGFKPRISYEEVGQGYKSNSRAQAQGPY